MTNEATKAAVEYFNKVEKEWAEAAKTKEQRMEERYATLAAAARRLVEAVQRREMSYETAAFVENDYEVLASTKEQLEAATEWNAALAEVEALLGEG